MKNIRNEKIIKGIVGIILFLVIIFTGFWIINNVFIKEVKAQEQPDENLLNIQVLQYHEQTSDTHNIFFNTKLGVIDNLSIFHSNMLTYFNTNVVYFLPKYKGDYHLLDFNNNTLQIIYDFDYLEINSTDITFYRNNLMIYNTTLLNVTYMIWEWNGTSWGAEYNNGYQDATNVFNERLEQLKIDYENKINLIKDYYESQGYNHGYDDGASISESEAYQLGYNKGANDSFLSGIKVWIVPAIIVVIILGGFVTIIQKRKDGDT